MLLAGSATPVEAADSLATPISAEMATAEWPVEVRVEIASVSGKTPAQTPALDAESEESPEAPLPERTIVVPDGQRLDFNSSVRSDHGRLDFELRVVPRVHPHGAVELEWDLLVSEAKFRPMGVGGYVAHRLELTGNPELGPSLLSIARSDIVSTTGETFLEEVSVGGQKFEIRILAQTMRG